MFNSYLTAHKDCLIFLDPENAQRKCSSVVISDKIAIEHPGVTIEACKVAKMEGYTGEARVRRWFRVWQLCGGGEVSSHHTTTGDYPAATLEHSMFREEMNTNSVLTCFSKSRAGALADAPVGPPGHHAQEPPGSRLGLDLHLQRDWSCQRDFTKYCNIARSMPLLELQLSSHTEQPHLVQRGHGSLLQRVRVDEPLPAGPQHHRLLGAPVVHPRRGC